MVDNPEFSTSKPAGDSNPRFVTAVVSLRESSVISLARNGMLDTDQVAAAWRFRRAWETVKAMPPGSAGFDEFVGGGYQATTYAEKQMAAAAELRTCRSLLGAYGYDLVSRVCGEGFHIRDLYQARRARDSAIDLLKVHLTELARLWG